MNEIDASFKANTTIKKNRHGWDISCNKGLWGVSCKSKKACMREARHYFIQYFSDGEYNTLQKEININKHVWYSNSIVGVNTKSRHQRLGIKVKEGERVIDFFIDEQDSMVIAKHFRDIENKLSKEDKGE